MPTIFVYWFTADAACALALVTAAAVNANDFEAEGVSAIQ
jgi:hypothetical protein